MATHDYNIANDTHANVRSDLNNALAAVRTVNSSSSAPATVFANMIYANTSTTPNIYYVRNNGDSAWSSIFTDTGLIRAEAGAVGGPSIGWSSTTTHGLYYGSSTSWSAAVAGVNAFTLSTTLHGWNLAAGDIDFSIGATTGGANSFFVQGSDGFIGFGTNAPAFNLHSAFDGSGSWCISRAFTGASGSALIFRKSRGTHASPSATSTNDSVMALQGQVYHSTGTPGFVLAGTCDFLTAGAESGDTVPVRWRVRTMAAGGTLTERMTVLDTGYVGIGATPTLAAFEVANPDATTFSTGQTIAARFASADAIGAGIYGYKSRGTIASPTDVSAGDVMASFQGYGRLNSDWRAAGKVSVVADAASGSIVRGRYEVYTTGTAGTDINREAAGCYKTLTDSVATTIFTMACANNTGAGCILEYFVESADASNVIQVHTGIIPISVCNTAGTVTTQVGTPTTATQSNLVTGGSMTVAVTASAANPSVVAINANPSTTSTLLRCVYRVSNLSNQTITIS